MPALAVWLHPVAEPPARVGIQTTAHSIRGDAGLAIHRGRFGAATAVKTTRPPMTGSTTILMPSKAAALTLHRRILAETTAWRYLDEATPETEIPAAYIVDAAIAYGVTAATELSFSWIEL